MASTECPQIHVKARWWVIPYLRTLRLLRVVMGIKPARDRVTALIFKHGFKIVRG